MRKGMLLLLAAVILLPAAGAVGADKPEAQLETSWQDLVRTQQWGAARKQLHTLLIAAARRDALKDANALAEAYYWYNVCRYVPLLEERLVDEKLRAAFTAWLLRERAFTEQFFCSLDARDDPGKAMVVLADLVRQFGDRVTAFPALAIAYATVFDTANYDPAAVLAGFDYYTSNNSVMSYDLRRLPPELCAFIVDGRASLPEKQWALNAYHGNTDPVALCDDVRYDAAAARDPAHKGLQGDQYTLLNLRKYGGTAVDRVYFAGEVGKAVGVPSVTLLIERAGYTTARVGYLNAVGGGRFEWRFGVGRRYREMEDEADGATTEPRTQTTIRVEDLDHAAALINLAPAQKRLFVLDLGVASLLIGEEGQPRLPGEAPKGGKEMLPVLDAALALATKARRIDPLALEPWRVVVDAAMQNPARGDALLEMAFTELFRDRVLREWPHAQLRVFRLLLAALPPTALRERLLACKQMTALFARRPPFLARAQWIEAQCLADAGRRDQAFLLLARVTPQYAALGDVVLDLLTAAQKYGRGTVPLAQIIQLYEATLRGIPRPQPGPLVAQSTYGVALSQLIDLYRLQGNRPKLDQATQTLNNLEQGLAPDSHTDRNTRPFHFSDPSPSHGRW